MVRGDVYLLCSQLVELSRTFSHFLISSRKLNVGRLLPFLTSWLWRCLVEGECLFKCLRTYEVPSPAALSSFPPNPGSNLKAAQGEEVEVNRPESQRSGAVPPSISAPRPLPLGCEVVEVVVESGAGLDPQL